MLSVKQGGIKYHFLSLWYDSTIGEHSNHYATAKFGIRINKGGEKASYHYPN